MSQISDYHTNSLGEALVRVGQANLWPIAIGHLVESTEAINAQLHAAVLAEIPAFTESNNPHTLLDLAEHGPEHTVEIMRLLDGGPISDFEFVRRHAERRAEQNFPLEVTLHAYRCGHKVFSRWVRDAVRRAASSDREASAAVGAVVDFTIEYTDAISTIFASAYVSHTRLLAEVAGDHREELLNILLDGYDESDGRVAQILRDAGYLNRRQSFCVVVGRSVDPAQMLNRPRARRLADSIDQLSLGAATRRVTDIRDNKVTTVFSDVRRVSGWTAPKTTLAKRISAQLSMLGNAVLIGVSNDVPSTSQIPSAHKQALLALELADVTHRVVQFAQIPARRLLLHFGGKQLDRVLPGWAEPFLAADAKAEGMLVATLRAYANADMNALKAAQVLSVHPNTIYVRLKKNLGANGIGCARLPRLDGTAHRG